MVAAKEEDHLSVILFQLNFSQNYLKKDFHHRKFFSTNPSSTPHPVKCQKSAKHDESF